MSSSRYKTWVTGEAGPWPSAYEPLGCRQGGSSTRYAHAPIIELPVHTALEEICVSIFILEHRIDMVGHSSPHGHIAGIVQLHIPGLLIIPPVHGARKEVGSAVVAPDHCSVHFLQVSWKTQIGDWAGISVGQSVPVEQPVLSVYKEDDLPVLPSLVHGVHMTKVAWKFLPEAVDLCWVARRQKTAIFVKPPEELALEDKQFSSDDGDGVI